MKLSSLVLSFLFSAWSLFVVYKVYDSERISKLAHIKLQLGSVVLPLLVLFSFWILIILLYLLIKENTKQMTVPVWLLVLLFILSVVIVVVSKALLLGVLKPSVILFGFLTLLYKLLASLSLGSLVILVWYGAGRRLLTNLRLTLSGKVNIVVSIGLGLVVYATCLLVLSLIGKLGGLFVLGTLGLMLAYGRPNVKGVVGLLSKRINLPSDLRWSVWHIALLLVAFQAVVSLATIVMPIPMGFDSLSYYFKLAQELARGGHYIFGQYAMPIELVYAAQLALGQLFGLSEIAEMLAIMLAWFAGLWGFSCIVLLGKAIRSWKAGLLAGCIYLAMPIVGFYQNLEPKPEIFIVPFIALSLLTIKTFWNKFNFRSGLIIGILLMFAFTIKITSIFGITALFIAICLYLLFKGQYFQILKLITSFSLTFTLLVIPWFALHFSEQPYSFTESINRLKQGQYYSILLLGQHPMRVKWRGSFISAIKPGIVATGYVEDYDRYLGKELGWFGLERFLPKNVASFPFARFITIPWDVTALNNVVTTNFMITPLFLIFVVFAPIALLFVSKKRRPKSFEIFLLVFTFIYGLLWWKEGRAIVWYGIGLFVPLTILSSAFWYWLKKHLAAWAVYVGWFVILGSCLIGLLIQVERLKNPSVLAYAVGTKSKHEAILGLTQGYAKFADTINMDDDIRSGKKYVMISGSYLHYFIDNYYETTIYDLWIDNLTAIIASGEGDYSKSKELLKKLDIKYIIFDLGTHSNDETDTRSLTTKHKQFMEFASQQLLLREYNKEMGVLLLEVN